MVSSGRVADFKAKWAAGSVFVGSLLFLRLWCVRCEKVMATSALFFAIP